MFSFKEEDEDEDYLIHTLFLKNVSFCSARFDSQSCMQPFCHVVDILVLQNVLRRYSLYIDTQQSL